MSARVSATPGPNSPGSGRPSYRIEPRPVPNRRKVSVSIGMFVGVLLMLQMFLLTVAVDALLADNDGLAWVTGGLSMLLAAGSLAFYRYLQ